MSEVTISCPFVTHGIAAHHASWPAKVYLYTVHHRELEVGSRSGIFRERTHAARLPHRGEGCDLRERRLLVLDGGEGRWEQAKHQIVRGCKSVPPPLNDDFPVALDMIPRLPQNTVP
jgi:hypothetical protein